ncbi:DUF5691 domain-containing protein [Pseudonocardia sp. CA-107938]|uniref:DUF5691 domain-containing protein n=1 Tax=Pseudonocardia sp. CA-107938 TaxID=3240021 RepID=UPI003D90BBCA
MSTWDELVAAATVGTGTRAVAVTDLPGVAAEHGGAVSTDEPAAALLDAAALLLTRQRAGLVPAPPAGDGPSPAPAENSPELTPLAADVLSRRLTAADALVLPVLLEETARAGRIVPPPVLPALLEAATRQRELRTAAAAVAGRRGRWLAGFRPEWSWLAARPADPADPQVWETGGRLARQAHLAALRATDPDAARDLLATGWARETGEDRAAFVAELRVGLDAADEPFLEAALDDRAAAVRATAADLLAVLPGSGYARRAAERARAVLHVRQGVRGTVLEPEPPAQWTPALGRDGVAQDPPQGARISQPRWWLVQVIARAPLTTWGDDPALARAAVADDLAPEVHAGWRIAARREGHQQWITALLATAPRLEERTAVFRSQIWVPDGELAEALPPAVRAARIARLLRTDPAALRLAELQACPRPWPDALAAAVLARIADAASRGEPVTPAVRELVRLAGAGLPADRADTVTAFSRRAPEHTLWPATIRGLAAVLQVRHTFATELTRPDPSEPTP